jgi:hypothetical protein
MDQRHYPRIQYRDLTAKAGDNKSFFQGTVKNISQFGLCVSDLPAEIDDNLRVWSLLVNGDNMVHKLSVSPRWSVITGQKKSVGVEILDPPLGWTEFVPEIPESPYFHLS